MDADAGAALDAARKQYGLSDPRYAQALEASAEMLLAEGTSLSLALDRVAEAAGIYFQNKHDRFADALALEAEIAIKGDDVKPFADVAEVPERVIEAIAHAAIQRSSKLEPATAMILQRSLYAFLLERVGESHPAAVRVLAHLANTAGVLGLDEERRGLLDSLVASFECINALPQAITALIQRSAIETKLGLLEQAQETKAEAKRRAEEIGMPELVTGL